MAISAARKIALADKMVGDALLLTHRAHAAHDYRRSYLAIAYDHLTKAKTALEQAGRES